MHFCAIQAFHRTRERVRPSYPGAATPPSPLFEKPPDAGKRDEGIASPVNEGVMPLFLRIVHVCDDFEWHGSPDP